MNIQGEPKVLDTFLNSIKKKKKSNWHTKRHLDTNTIYDQKFLKTN